MIRAIAVVQIVCFTVNERFQRKGEKIKYLKEKKNNYFESQEESTILTEKG